MKLICAHKLSECLNFVSLFVTPSKGVLPYNSVCLGLQCWSTGFFGNYLKGVLPYNSVCLGLQCWSTGFFGNYLLEKTKERRKTHRTTRAHASKMADAEAKPVVEFTKVLLSHITTTRFFFFKICLDDAFVFSLFSLACVMMRRRL